MQTFDDSYLLDLHGNNKKKETALGGGKDQNVFDIQQGVAIGIFVKREGSKTKLAPVRHAYFWRTRSQIAFTPKQERMYSAAFMVIVTNVFDFMHFSCSRAILGTEHEGETK